jgi:hypothetical protein
MKLLHSVCCGMVVVGREVSSLYLHGAILQVQSPGWVSHGTRRPAGCRCRTWEVIAPMIEHQIRKVSSCFALKQKCTDESVILFCVGDTMISTSKVAKKNKR